MYEIIKGSNPFENVVIEGDAVIDNGSGNKSQDVHGKKSETSEKAVSDKENDTSGNDETDESESESEKIDFAQLEYLREQYRREGQEYAVEMHKRADAELEKAREEAEGIIETAKDKGRRLLAQISEKSEDTYDEARKKGLDEGFMEGLKKGEEEGYIRGLKRCRDALLELKHYCEEIEREKENILAEQRRNVFDLAMEVAEKITMTVFTQKDKKALEKMITSAAKEFRNTKNIRVILSKHDVSEDMEADFKLYEKCFSPTANVEFEVVDGESGTLMLESDSEIIDAGVSTQLKMIGELGRGKFRNKEDETPTEPEPSAKPKAAKTSRAAKNAKPVKEVKELKPELTAEAEGIIAETAEVSGIEEVNETAAAEVEVPVFNEPIEAVPSDVTL